MSSTIEHITISANSLSIGYKGIAIANQINFEAKAGELIGIVGVNGIGKSTLLRTLGKIQTAISGTIAVDSKSLDTIGNNDLSKKLSLVLTESIASKNLTVKELIALGRQPYTNWIGSLTKVDISKITETIQRLELEDLVEKKCYQLSDGQMQRVLIARALAQDTPIILLDEPTTHLDLHHKAQILKLLKAIATETKKTIVFTSHEIEMALQLCDKILVLNNSQPLFGRPNELIEQGVFDNLFPSSIISFDANSRTFRIKK